VEYLLVAHSMDMALLAYIRLGHFLKNNLIFASRGIAYQSGAAFGFSLFG
jgi:hypothetical protein